MNPIETHEKNLAWIDKQIDLYTFALRQSMDDSEFNATSSGRKSLRANRKVLERHRPRNEFCDSCSRSAGRGITFPCQTYVDVTDGLGISE